VILKLFSKAGLRDLFKTAILDDAVSDNSKQFLLYRKNTSKRLIRPFCKEKSNLSTQICQEDYLPEASRFSQLEELDWAFGTMGTQDKAIWRPCTSKISPILLWNVDANFGFSRYAERLGRSANSFDELYGALQNQLISMIFCYRF
jgi:hypothetical protein